MPFLDLLTGWLRRPADGGPAAPPANDPFSTGKFPLCPATHDQGLRWLFDLATVLLLLDCRPGERVLDLGAGSGFSSEMLARFGYEVVAIDPDLAALRRNRARPAFDAARIEGHVRVAGAVAERLPFAHDSFDGVIGLNVMHHVPDLGEATAEIARVLRPGGRAVFCEPGLDHLQDPETRRAMREHGEGDRSFDVLAFLADARTRGFSQALLPATLQSPLRLVPVEEVELFRSGRHPNPRLTPAGVVHELHAKHAYALLVKAGARPRTSRHPGDLRGDIRVDGLPAHLHRGRRYRAEVVVRNTGDTVWLSAVSRHGGFVTIGSKLLAPDGRLIDDGVARTHLRADIAPGDTCTVPVEVTIPLSVAPGRYELCFDLVNELVCWFADLPGNERSGTAVVVI